MQDEKLTQPEVVMTVIVAISCLTLGYMLRTVTTRRKEKMIVNKKGQLEKIVTEE